MTPERYDSLSNEERYRFMHFVAHEAENLTDWDTDYLPTPGQIAHQHFDDLPKGSQLALKQLPDNTPTPTLPGE